jgi:hypothetical protein
MADVQIELVGGPQDGAVITVPTSKRDESNPLTTGRLGDYSGLPVHRRPDGRLYVRWPKYSEAA